MALQIRRGTDVDRQGITPKAGEPIFTTDTKKLYIGDGTTAGGIIVDTTAGLSSVVEDTTPQLGGNLDLNNFDITGTGDIAITGQISASAIDLKGSIFADDSTLLVDGINGTLHGNLTGDVTSQTISTTTISVEDIVNSSSTFIYNGGEGKFFGDLEGNVTSPLLTANNIESTNEATNNKPIKLFHYADDQTRAADIEYSRGKNTEASPTVVGNNDHLGRTTFYGYDGSDFQQSVQIVAAVKGTVSAGAVPGKLSFFLTNEAGTSNKIAEIRGEGEEFVVTNILSVDGLIKSNAGAEFRRGLSGDLTGSVFSDDSTLLVDAVNGAISVANADLVGTEDDGTGVDVVGGVTGYLQVTVNGASKFIPLYDPA